MQHPVPGNGNILAWARIYAAITKSHSKSLRKGTWYPVVADDRPDRVSLLVGTNRVDVPRNLLEIRDRRPVYFSLVTRFPTGKPGDTLEPHHPGKRYVVCPDCDHRNSFFGHPERILCEKCEYEGEIAWWE
jgi:hypothetical protein